MPSLIELERRIQADRAAAAEYARRVRLNAERRVGSPAGLLSGFAVGFAGGWFTVSEAKRRRERAKVCPPPASAGQTQAPPKKSKLEGLRTLFVLTLPLWQSLMAKEPAPPEAHDPTN